MRIVCLYKAGSHVYPHDATYFVSAFWHSSIHTALIEILAVRIYICNFDCGVGAVMRGVWRITAQSVFWLI